MSQKAETSTILPVKNALQMRGGAPEAEAQEAEEAEAEAGAGAATRTVPGTVPPFPPFLSMF